MYVRTANHFFSTRTPCVPVYIVYKEIHVLNSAYHILIFVCLCLRGNRSRLLEDFKHRDINKDQTVWKFSYMLLENSCTAVMFCRNITNIFSFLLKLCNDKLIFHIFLSGSRNNGIKCYYHQRR